METLQLDPPRWPDGPPICPHANLPALPTPEALRRFLDTNGTLCKTRRIWQCLAGCQLWHADTIAH
jgi:hypothetical protein